jgi:indole-3-glycerol phosphate synthase
LETLDFNCVNILGINNRDLGSFNVDLATTVRLAPLVPGHVTLVSESGIGSPADLVLLASLGIHAALIGENLMRAPDPEEALRELLARSRESASCE